MGFEKESGRIEMRELPSLRKLWSRQLGDVFMMEFTHDSNAFVAMHKNPRELHFLDSLAGEAKSRIPLPPRDRGYPSVIESTEKRSLVIWNGSSQNDPDSVRAKLGRWIPLLKAWSERESESLVVIDCASFAERFRLSLSATLEYAQYCDADGTLATYHRTGSENAIKIWNVNAWKPLHYCIGVPATVGGIAILFRWWRCRRNRSKRSPAPPVNPGIESPTPN
jgi:hypothetical protein